MNNMMNIFELSHPEQTDINVFFHKTRPSRQLQENLDKLLSLISYSMQIRTMTSIFLPAIYSNSVVSLFLLSQYKNDKSGFNRIKLA